MQAVGHCSAEKLIPIWMIVGGLLGLVIDIMWTVNRIVDYRCTYLRDEDDNYIRSCKCFVLCIVWFFLALGWFIAGNVWVYRIYAPQTSDVESSLYCEALVYYLAFWIITVFYICVCLTLIVCTFNCAYPGFTKCFSKK
ncbi:unnamed protein product [Clavelina lepadiformis]|uniref:Uncharacterized protein n=1 Tax=Clavelina lepadiformis TaxID=159417 RepID=A0ABP0F1U7_CLALP